MTQNTSSAVMQQRQARSKHTLNYFPTPLWATRALIEHVIGPPLVKHLSCLEPACGGGHMARALAEYFWKVTATDINDYGACDAVEDFLWPGSTRGANWIITNPPFKLAEQFITVALERCNVGVAMLVRIAFLEGQGRFERLFSKRPPSIVAQFTERVGMFEGRVADESSATAYCWLVWDRPARRPFTVLKWIPPCKEQLVRPGDWD